MEKFVKVHGVAAPMPAANIDTDIIMPKAYLKRIDKEGLDVGVFHDQRFRPDGTPRDEFVLNKPRYKEARFLVVGDNFGCGSSREHAVWGLQKIGIRAVIGSSFAGIFFDNLANNGVLAIVLDQDKVDELLEIISKPGQETLSIDLENRLIESPSGIRIEFEIDSERRNRLLNGLDKVDSTLLKEKEILDFEKDYYKKYPWLDM